MTPAQKRIVALRAAIAMLKANGQRAARRGEFARSLSYRRQAKQLRRQLRQAEQAAQGH